MMEALINLAVIFFGASLLFSVGCVFAGIFERLTLK